MKLSAASATDIARTALEADANGCTFKHISTTRMDREWSVLFEVTMSNGVRLDEAVAVVVNRYTGAVHVVSST
jgi:hypothetical protein